MFATMAPASPSSVAATTSQPRFLANRMRLRIESSSAIPVSLRGNTGSRFAGAGLGLRSVVGLVLSSRIFVLSVLKLSAAHPCQEVLGLKISRDKSHPGTAARSLMGCLPLCLLQNLDQSMHRGLPVQASFIFMKCICRHLLVTRLVPQGVENCLPKVFGRAFQRKATSANSLAYVITNPTCVKGNRR